MGLSSTPLPAYLKKTGPIGVFLHRVSSTLAPVRPPAARRTTDSGRIIAGSVAAEDSRRALPAWKRLLDLSVILLTAPGWLPVMLGIAAWIKIVSPGPVFFTQERVGYRAGRFTIFKFRSMKVNAETRCHENHVADLMKSDCPLAKLDNAGDPRIIPGGRLLRATGLDELPQIINVLRGEMSLVGPRPCTKTEYVHYEESQQKRFDALPGLTGYWQVNGKNKTTFSEMVQMDIHYSRSKSLLLDITIMARTPKVLVGQLIESRRKKAAQPSSAPPRKN
jgi:lipopolysaccharide/colanic/teichoic acid biosynthesis glycosyltransferase